MKPPLSSDGSIDAFSTMIFTAEKCGQLLSRRALCLLHCVMSTRWSRFFQNDNFNRARNDKAFDKGNLNAPESLRGIGAPKRGPGNSGTCTFLQDEGNARFLCEIWIGT